MKDDSLSWPVLFVICAFICFSLFYVKGCTDSNAQAESNQYKIENAHKVNIENTFRIYDTNYTKAPVFLGAVYTVCIDGAKYIYVNSHWSSKWATPASLVPFTGENTCKK